MNFQQLLKRKRQRWLRAMAIMTISLMVICVMYLVLGGISINPLSPSSGLESRLLWDLRMPRLVAALFIGAALSVAGATLQVLLGNSLAEPGVIGISGGASVGMMGAFFFFPAAMTTSIFMFFAMGGALSFTLLLVVLGHTLRLTTAKLLLVGVALGILSGAVVTWAFYFSDGMNLRQLMYWLMGSLGGVTWQQHHLTLILLLPMLWLILKGNALDKWMIGEAHAKQQGLNVDRLRWQLIIAVAILVGGAVALGGVIGFIGLIVPHLIRLMLGSENRMLLPLSALGGAGLLAVSDLVARTAISGGELPLGVVTTTIGAPIFIWMLVKHHD